MSSHTRRLSRARPIMVWTVLTFLAIQVALNAAVVPRYPRAQDPEYAVRLELLRDRMAEGPDRPLCLVMGSSRLVDSFAPEQLAPLPTPDAPAPLVFNFAHLGAGPGGNLMILRRLLREGITPKWLVVEVMPPQLGDRKQGIMIDGALARDLSMTRRYHNPVWVYAEFARRDLAPSFKYRHVLAPYIAPGWVTEADLIGSRFPVLPLGGSPKQIPRDPGRTHALTESARLNYAPALQKFEVTELSVRTSRDLLKLCSHRGITVVLLLTPEAKSFQSWYSPDARRQVDEFTDSLSREYDVPLVDARNWLADEEFIDGHHTDTPGAAHFTERLGREVLTPLVQGRLPAPSRASAIRP